MLKNTIELVEHNALHDLSYNWQDGDGTIVLHLCFITIFKGWSDVCTLPFQWDLSNLRLRLKRLQRGLAIAPIVNFSALASIVSQPAALRMSTFFNRSVTMLSVNANSSTSAHSGLCLVVGLLSVLVTMCSIWLMKYVLMGSAMSLLPVSSPSSVCKGVLVFSHGVPLFYLFQSKISWAVFETAKAHLQDKLACFF